MSEISVSLNNVIDLINNTKTKKLGWLNLAVLKEYLRNIDVSLNEIDQLHKFLLHLQKDKFIFNCINTYVTVFNEKLYILSQSKYSLIYRLDVLDLNNNNALWKRNAVPSRLLLRLRNTILLTNNEDLPEECSEFLDTISHCRVV